MKNLQRAVRILVVVLGAAAAVLFFLRLRALKEAPAPAAESAAGADDLGTGEPFTLTERSGRPVSLSDLKGRPWVASFIFTRCPGPCPILTANMAKLEKEFAGKNARFVSISVDPEHDTPAVLADYAKKFGAPAGWYFLTGEKQTVYRMVADNFKLAVQEQPVNPQTGLPDFIHSLNFVLIDAQGRIRGYFNGTDDEALHRLRAALRQQVA
jgi:cytochrome oxidase Cu insertion factor (SCO1/SenC/PrrC family)